MSCCGGKNMNNFMLPTKSVKEFYGDFNPNNFYEQNQTYAIDKDNYYAPPWPIDESPYRTEYDLSYMRRFNPSVIPDFLVYNQGNKIQNLSRKSIFNGNVNFSY